MLPYFLLRNKLNLYKQLEYFTVSYFSKSSVKTGMLQSIKI